MIMKIKTKSFCDWCIENNRKDLLDCWDYELNSILPNKINYSSGKSFYFLCPNRLHKSELKCIRDIINRKMLICIECNSFYQWCIENTRQDLLERWDYELNKFSPKQISYGSKKRFYFKCPRGIHKSETFGILAITTNSTPCNCSECSSFGQWCIDNDRYDLLNRWDYELNLVSPFNAYKSAHKKYYFKCPVNLHPSKLIKLKQIGIDKNNFVKCDYCNSFAQWGY